MATAETSALAPDAETPKPDFPRLEHEWKISRARRDLAVAEASLIDTDEAFDAAIDAAN
jgi:hypothetical protein